MAYWINQAGNSNRADWRSFYCDNDADVSNLPNSVDEGVIQNGVDSAAHKCCSIGSACLSLATGNIFLLGSNNVWAPMSSGGSGSAGKDGASAYEIAVSNGFEGTEKEWLASLVGPSGKDGTPGVDGYSPTITENEENTEDLYRLDITTKEGTFTTPNLMGKDGSSIAENVPIESISVNGKTIIPENKNVDIQMPVKLSDLNNSDDEVPFHFKMERHEGIDLSPIIDVIYGDPQDIKFSFYNPLEHFDGSICFIADELCSFYADLGSHPDMYDMQEWKETDDIATLTRENGPYLVLSSKHYEINDENSSQISIYTYVIPLKEKVVDYISKSKEFAELSTNNKTIIGAINELAEKMKIIEI